MDVPQDVENTDRHPLVLLVSASFWVCLWFLSWVKSTVAFVTGLVMFTIPKLIYSILSYSMTLTLNFWSFTTIFILSAVALNYWLRFRYFNDYMQLKEPPLFKPDANELHPDVNSTAEPTSFHNYFETLLQAIRVFGFLEKPVFHELARHLQTRRLIAGDSITLDDDKNFYCVVDGVVQVYAQTGTRNEAEKGSWDDEDTNGYQLLNEVGSGGTLSSLFTILSLFTEDVKISWQDDLYNANTPADGVADGVLLPDFRRMDRANSDVSQFDLEIKSPGRQNGRRASMSSEASTIHADPVSPAPTGGTEYAYATNSGASTPVRPVRPKVRRPTQIHQGVVARATEDSTLAVIPAEAFRRLTKNFPKASSHIVQVILTRFSRVTFSAAHKYLGLTTEVLRTEKAINDIACHPLPPSFYERGGLQYLRQRFEVGVTNNVNDRPEGDYFGHIHSPPTAMLSPQRANSGSSAPKVMESPLVSSRLLFPLRSSPYRAPGSLHQVQAGDLHSSTGHPSDAFRPLQRAFSILGTPHLNRLPSIFGSDDEDSSLSENGDDFDLRKEVMSCIAKSIGLLQPPLSGGDSIETSPAVLPSDARRPSISNSLNSSTSSLFHNSFGSLTMFDTPGDDSSSMTGSSSMLSNDTAYMSGLDNEIEILFFPAGSTLVKAGELNTGLFYVIEGFLDILLPIAQATEAKNTEKPSKTNKGKGADQKLLFTVKPGGIAGYLASLTHTASYVDIKAKTDTYVGSLPSHALEKLLEKRPIVLLTLAKRLISLLSPIILHIDTSLDWVHVNAGQVLWRPEDISDSFYIVINGRLRAISEKEDVVGVSILGEYGLGDTVGELDVITSSPRRNTVHAIRDTELIRMPRTLFNAISARNPQTTAQLLKMIASRVRDEMDSSPTGPSRKATSELGHNNANLKTVAVIPTSRNVPIDAFARKLHAALEAMGASTSFLNQASISGHLGRHAFSKMGKLKSAGWLADQEQKYRTVLYVADSPVNSPWTQTCIRQADYVMVVGMGDDPGIGEYERLLLSMKTTARKELILLHPDRSVNPGSTREWLKLRPWVHQHIHVELPGLVLPVSKVVLAQKGPDAVAALKNLKDKVQTAFRGSTVNPQPQRPVNSNDFSRLARRLVGRSIGVVLGGGGARGISHLGMIRALEEYGIPIDHIGGTSIGAFIGGLYAREGDILSSSGRAKQFSGRMANIWRILSDITYPIVAYTTGHEFNRSIYKAFYDLHIEDMWLPFFCNTTNINTSRMDIHENGYAWRFIRASMTLVGMLPPLVGDNGHMLVDGGYVDNLPVAAMFSMGASIVFASDVGSLYDNSPRNFGDTVSGWWLLVNRWNPFSSYARSVPAITEIQSRLAYVSSVRTLEEAKVAAGCLYMAIPVQEYGTLQFSKFEEIQKKGYHASMDILSKMDEEGRLPPAVIGGRDTKSKRRNGRSARRNSI